MSDHAQEVLKNVYEQTGVMQDIISFREPRDYLENYLKDAGLTGSPIIISSSEDIVFTKNRDDLLNREDYAALKEIGNSENIVLFQAGGNISNLEYYVLNEDIKNWPDFKNGWYSSASAATNFNNIIPVES